MIGDDQELLWLFFGEELLEMNLEDKGACTIAELQTFKGMCHEVSGSEDL